MTFRIKDRISISSEYFYTGDINKKRNIFFYVAFAIDKQKNM